MFDKIIDLISNEKNIIIFGDLVLDKYVEITSSRLSSETIIPVMKPEKKYSFLGCAGNVAKIINEFNCNVFLISIIGKNLKTIENICVEENINIDYSIINKDVNQSKKRYIHNNQQYFRIDNCDNIDYQKYKIQIEDNFKNCIQKNNIDMIIIPDYNLGLCDDLSNIIEIAKENNIKIVIDPHGNDIMKYKGCNLFKPNKNELQQLTNINIKNNNDLIKSAEKIINVIDCDIIVTTLGSAGIFVYEKNGKSNIISTKKINFIDVCGAGDTINSIISLGLISELSIEDVCKIANIFASIFIKKIGTSKMYFYEILNVSHNRLECTAFEVTVFLAARVSVTALDAHNICLMFIGLSYLSMPLGISIAASIRVGNLLGALNKNRFYDLHSISTKNVGVISGDIVYVVAHRYPDATPFIHKCHRE